MRTLTYERNSIMVKNLPIPTEISGMILLLCLNSFSTLINTRPLNMKQKKAASGKTELNMTMYPNCITKSM